MRVRKRLIEAIGGTVKYDALTYKYILKLLDGNYYLTSKIIRHFHKHYVTKKESKEEIKKEKLLCKSCKALLKPKTKSQTVEEALQKARQK